MQVHQLVSHEVVTYLRGGILVETVGEVDSPCLALFFGATTASTSASKYTSEPEYRSPSAMCLGDKVDIMSVLRS